MVKITGNKRHSRRLRKLPAATQAEVGKAIYAGAGIIEAEARVSITNGAVSGQGHVPSLPGEPPNSDTGQLARDITARKTGAMKAEVLSQAPYSAALEFGTSKMEERPFMRPATKKSRPQIEKLVGRSVSNAIKRT